MNLTPNLREALQFLGLDSPSDLTKGHVENLINSSDLVKVNPLFEAYFWAAFHEVRRVSSGIQTGVQGRELKEVSSIDKSQDNQKSRIFGKANVTEISRHRIYLQHLLNDYTKLNEITRAFEDLVKQEELLTELKTNWENGLGAIAAKKLSLSSAIDSLKGSFAIFNEVIFLYSWIEAETIDGEARSFFVGPFSNSIPIPGFHYMSLQKAIDSNLLFLKTGNQFTLGANTYVIKELNLANWLWLHALKNFSFWQNDFLSEIPAVLPDGRIGGSKIESKVHESWNGVLVVGHETVGAPNNSNNSRYRKGG